jgi:hypothetical protein
MNRPLQEPNPLRTTVTLDADVMRLLKRAMHERDLSFKQALNDAVRAGAVALSAQAQTKLEPPHWKVYDMGVPLVDLTKANALLGDMEAQDFIAKMNMHTAPMVAEPPPSGAATHKS